ncbi:MAG: helix-turn-helix domain-containing protein [Candidatus Bathyarchaeia archaeon]
MKPPCEIVVKHVLPMLRALIAKELSERYGLKQEESAKKLGITQSAVSYYLSGSRGAVNISDSGAAVLMENPRVKSAVREIARAITEDRFTTVQAIRALCETCMAIRSTDVCRMHMHLLPSIGENCNLCGVLFKTSSQK